MIVSPAARDALDCLERGHRPVPLQPGSKIPPPRFDLSGWLASPPPTESQVLRVFRGDINIGVALGEPSDGLTVRDFDVQDAYDRWAASFPALASSLPTVETFRGKHTYFTTTATEAASYGRGGTIAVFSDGELRRGGYTVLPCSRHPMGKAYRWTNPPNSFPFLADLAEAGLAAEKTCNQGKWHTRDIYTSGPDFGPTLEGLTVDQALQMAQPMGPGQRHFRLFLLVRFLRSIPETRDREPAELRGVVRKWHRLALPRITTKDFEPTWREFVDAWGRVRVPHGAALAAVAAEATGDGIDRLADLCRLLQARAEERPFFLDGRTAAAVLGIPHRTAARWLHRLRDVGTLRLVTQGTRVSRRASEYRFISR